MPYLFVLAAVVLRLLPHPWNATPLGAMFLFGGATFLSKRDSLLVPLAALLVSDVAVDRILYHGTVTWFSPWTWSAFLLVGMIGWALRNKINAGRVIVGTLAGSIVFFLVSNFGVWAAGQMYPRTAAGLAECYSAAVPFVRETLLGDLAYSAVMFGTYAWLCERKLRQITPAAAPQTR